MSKKSRKIDGSRICEITGKTLCIGSHRFSSSLLSIPYYLMCMRGRNLEGEMERERTGLHRMEREGGSAWPPHQNVCRLEIPFGGSPVHPVIRNERGIGEASKRLPGEENRKPPKNGRLTNRIMQKCLENDNPPSPYQRESFPKPLQRENIPSPKSILLFLIINVFRLLFKMIIKNDRISSHSFGNPLTAQDHRGKRYKNLYQKPH